MEHFNNHLILNQWAVVMTLFLCGCMSTVAFGQSQDTLLNPIRSTYFADLAKTLPLIYPKTLAKDRMVKTHSIMLRTEPAEKAYPLFCRLEDKINEGNKIQCLFRLGSVSYVNYLEQKGDHQRLMLEQIR